MSKPETHFTGSVQNHPRLKILRPPNPPVTVQQWSDWQWHLKNQINTVAELEKWLSPTVEEKRAIYFSQEKFHFSFTPYWASLMDPSDFLCPIRRQAIPLDEEFRTSVYEPRDFISDGVKVAQGRLTHLYPDRAILSLHSECVLYCRFCPQRKIVPRESKTHFFSFSNSQGSSILNEKEWSEIREYLSSHPQIQELILSGGEPFLLNDEVLHQIFSNVKAIPSIKNLRIETRILSVLPQRITSECIQMLKEFQPLYLILHVNHPREISPEFQDVCQKLADSGIPLASQTVLLKDLNDKVATLSYLFSTLFNLRVRPYRLVQLLPFQGTEHFRTTISGGLKIIENLRGRITGLSLPEYIVDTAGGKISLRYESILSRNKKRVLLKNCEGKVFVYPEKIFSFSS
ncbi:MAG: KamA family radical SAM protein [Elusimicrobia bacterium]|nr:KamA family radical SAM protein [Elusimicrobiota bacterium]